MKNEKLDLEELAALPFNYFGEPGRATKQIAFISNKTGRSELNVIDYETMKIKQLTNGEYPKSPVGFHKWAPDDSFILFVKDPVAGNEKNDIYSISVLEGKVTQLTDTPESRDEIGEVSHDGKWIVFGSDRLDGITQLFRMNIDGRNVKQLTDHARPVSSWYEFWISPDDKWIAYTANDSKNLQNQDVWIVKSDGSERKKLISIKDGSQDIAVAWSRNGSKLLFSSDHTGIEQAVIYSLETNDVKWLGNRKNAEWPRGFALDDRYIVVRRDVDAEIRLVLYEIDSGIEVPLNLPTGCATTRLTTVDNQLIVGHQDSTHRLRYLLYDLNEHTYDEVIPAEYGRYSSNDFHPDDYISYQSDNVAIHAILYKPKNIKAGEKLPAIVIPHGGPTSHYSRLFNAWWQAMVDRGFVLLLPNVRGSTGYDVEFRDACLNDWGGKDLDDIVAGVNYLKGLDFVDPDRIGITGGSYGGFMTYIAITKKPDLWKAASAYVGISSLMKMYETGKKTFPQLSYWMEEQMGKPDTPEVIELWEDRSAVNFVEDMTAKLQIIHAENDPRCPIDQAEIFRDRLLELGKKEGEDFEYLVLTDEGHGSMDVEQMTRMYKLSVEFFENNL